MTTPQAVPVVACLLGTLLLTSCSGQAAPESESSTSPTPDGTKTPTVVLDYEEEPEPEDEEEPPPPPIKPDRSLMKKMSCDAFEPEAPEVIISDFGNYTRSTQVKVGEGLIPGEEWWIVALELPADDSRDAGIRSFLTTEPGPPIPYVSWIEIGGDDPWASVEWSRKKLVVAESALTKAHECLGVKPEE